MMNKQEQLLELYDFITNVVNTKYPDISAFDRDDIIQDLYLKTYMTYLTKYKDKPKYKQNAYVKSRIKYYIETILPKQQLIYLHDYLQKFPKCELYYQNEYADIINKESSDIIISHTNKRRKMPARRQDIIKQYICNNISSYDIEKQYCVTPVFVRQQIVQQLCHWFENKNIGHVYNINGLITITAFTTD